MTWRAMSGRSYPEEKLAALKECMTEYYDELENAYR